MCSPSLLVQGVVKMFTILLRTPWPPVAFYESQDLNPFRLRNYYIKFGK